MGRQDLRRLQIDVVESVDRRVRVRRRHHDVVTERLARPHVSIAACNVQHDIATSAHPGSREITSPDRTQMLSSVPERDRAQHPAQHPPRLCCVATCRTALQATCRALQAWCTALQLVLNRPRPMLLSILRDTVALEQLARTCNRGEMLEGEMIEVAALSSFMSKPIPASIARTAVSASMSYLQPCTCQPLSLVPLPLSSLALLSSPLRSSPLSLSPPLLAAPPLSSVRLWCGKVATRARPDPSARMGCRS
jgi:hypothetical protein